MHGRRSRLLWLLCTFGRGRWAQRSQCLCFSGCWSGLEFQWWWLYAPCAVGSPGRVGTALRGGTSRKEKSNKGSMMASKNNSPAAVGADDVVLAVVDDGFRQMKGLASDALIAHPSLARAGFTLSLIGGGDGDAGLGGYQTSG
eukprot:gene17086-20491_t